MNVSPDVLFIPGRRDAAGRGHQTEVLQNHPAAEEDAVTTDQNSLFFFNLFLFQI